MSIQKASAEAQALIGQGKPDEAIAVYEKALQDEPDPNNRTDLHLMFAEFLWQADKKERSLACYDAALTIVKELGDTVTKFTCVHICSIINSVSPYRQRRA
jgi:tetratricopeptide (TPR) repeat protein